MCKLDALCVKVQPVSWLSVQGIPFYGAAKAVRMCGMEAQLMGASRFGVEENAPIVLKFIEGDGPFSVLTADHLSRTVKRIGQQRQCDAAFGGQVGRRSPIQ